MEIIDEKNFKEKISKGVVLVDFFATWCGPCRMMAPVLDSVKKELGDAIEIYKVDVDESENLARQYGIMSIPTLFVFVNGEEKEHSVGLLDKNRVVNLLKKYL